MSSPPRPLRFTAVAAAPAGAHAPAEAEGAGQVEHGRGGGAFTLKVALVSDWFHPRLGGIELHLLDLAQRLTAEGHEVHVVTSTPGDDVVDGIRIHRLRAPRLPGAGVVYTAGALRELEEVMRRERFDVAHCHVSIVSPVAVFGARAAHRVGLPAVVTYHSVIPALRPITRVVNAVLRCSTWRALHTAVSRMVASQVRPLAGAKRVQRLPNAIDVERWRVVPFPSDPRDVRFVTVMRLVPKKRPRALVHAFRKLAMRVGSEYDVRLRIIGDGPEMPHLRRLVRRYGLTDRVTLLGALTREEIRAHFAHADVFVMPARMESFGIAALEARSAGLPVIAIAGSGIADFVRDGQEGLLARDDRDMVRCMERLVRDPALRLGIAEHNRCTPAPLGWRGVLARHVRLYRDAILASAR